MSFTKLLEEGQFYEVQRTRWKTDNLEEQAIAFSGSIRPHYNPNMLLLLTHPLETRSSIFEFRLEDVLYAEELPSISRPNGVTVEQTRLWVKRGSPAMRMQPVRVGEIDDEHSEGEQ